MKYEPMNEFPKLRLCVFSGVLVPINNKEQEDKFEAEQTRSLSFVIWSFCVGVVLSVTLFVVLLV